MARSLFSGSLNRLTDLAGGLAEIVAPLDESELDESVDGELSDRSFGDDTYPRDGGFSASPLPPSPHEHQFQRRQEEPADDSAAVARLTAELNEKHDELAGLESQLAELKNIIRSNTSGSTQLIVEALQAVYPDATSENATASIHRLAVDRDVMRGHLTSVRQLADDLWSAHGGVVDSASTSIDTKTDEGTVLSLRTLVEMLAAALRNQRAGVAASRTATEAESGGPGEQQQEGEDGDEEGRGVVDADSGASGMEGAAEATKTLEKDLDHMRQQLESARATNHDLSKHLEGARAELEKEKQTCDEAERQTAALRQQLQEVAVQQEQLEAAHVLSQQHVQGDTEAARVQLEGSLAKKEHEIAQLKQIISQLQTSKKNRSQEVEATARERDELRTRTLAQAAELETLQAANVELRQAIREGEERDQDCGALTDQVAKLEQAAAEQHEANAKVENELRGKLNVLTQRHLAAQQSDHETSARLRVAEADLELARQDHQRSSTAAANLQNVLEQFQVEKQAEIDQICGRKQKEIEATAEAAEIQLQHVKMAHEGELSASQKTLAVVEAKLERLSKEGADEKRSLQRTLDNAITQLSSQRGDVVDKRLAASLVVQYVSKKFSMEVLALLARIFSFTEDELVKVGLRTRRRGLLGLITPLDAPTIEGAEDAGLAELWVRFLNEEVGDEQ